MLIVISVLTPRNKTNTPFMMPVQLVVLRRGGSLHSKRALRTLASREWPRCLEETGGCLRDHDGPTRRKKEEGTAGITIPLSPSQAYRCNILDNGLWILALPDLPSVAEG